MTKILHARKSNTPNGVWRLRLTGLIEQYDNGVVADVLSWAHTELGLDGAAPTTVEELVPNRVRQTYALLAGEPFDKVFI